MKRFSLSLLLSMMISTQSLKSSDFITNLGPIQIITTNGSNVFAPGISKLNGTIYLGQSTNDIIYFEGQHISKGQGVGSNNITTVMSIDSAGQVVTGPLVELGSSNNNRITCPATSGDLTVQSANNGNIILDSIEHIKFLSPNDLITNPAANPVLLALDSNNNIVTSNKGDKFIFGNSIDPDTAYITVDNSPTNPTGIILDTSNTTASNIFLNAGLSNNIIIAGNGINNAAAGQTSILLINDAGAIQSANGSTDLNCGSLTAAEDTLGQTITLGYSGENQIAFTNNTGNLMINAQSTGSNIVLNTYGEINLSSANLNPTINSGLALTVLALDRTGNMITSETNNLFVYGNNNTGKNYIEIDNADSLNGITLGGTHIFLKGQGLSPAVGYTNTLTIDNNGKIGILISSKQYKENIIPLNINEKDIENLVAVSYNYVGKNQTEYGFIAEELITNESLKNAVIFDQNGKPMSINYNSVFVAIAHQFLKTKNNLENKIDTLENEITLLKEALQKIYKQLEI